MSKIVFTNGCFDILHSGHIELLEKASALGTRLVVGINSDDSVRAIKGPGRPIVNQMERAAVLIGLESVDEVRVFDETTPAQLIQEIKPDVLVKGGDWIEDQIVGADFVRSYGGDVVSVPLKKGLSTSAIIDRIASRGEEWAINDSNDKADDTIVDAINEHLSVFESLKTEQGSNIEACAKLIVGPLRNGAKILVCGNGGSAADAQHFAAEIVGRYETERKSLPAIALTTDTSALTAISNDYGFESVFSRQLEGLAAKGDTLIAISTSGNSPNVVKAIMTARNFGCNVVGLTSVKGRKMAALCDACVMVPSERTSRIQEAHLATIHIWCELVDEEMSV